MAAQQESLLNVQSNLAGSMVNVETNLAGSMVNVETNLANVVKDTISESETNVLENLEIIRSQVDVITFSKKTPYGLSDINYIIHKSSPQMAEYLYFNFESLDINKHTQSAYVFESSSLGNNGLITCRNLCTGVYNFNKNNESIVGAGCFAIIDNPNLQSYYLNNLFSHVSPTKVTGNTESDIIYGGMIFYIIYVIEKLYIFDDDKTYNPLETDFDFFKDAAIAAGAAPDGSTPAPASGSGFFDNPYFINSRTNPKSLMEVLNDKEKLEKIHKIAELADNAFTKRPSFMFPPRALADYICVFQLYSAFGDNILSDVSNTTTGSPYILYQDQAILDDTTIGTGNFVNSLTQVTVASFQIDKKTDTKTANKIKKIVSGYITRTANPFLKYIIAEVNNRSNSGEDLGYEVFIFMYDNKQRDTYNNTDPPLFDLEDEVLNDSTKLVYQIKSALEQQGNITSTKPYLRLNCISLDNDVLTRDINKSAYENFKGAALHNPFAPLFFN